MTKSERQKSIVELVNQYEIDTQEELVEKLKTNYNIGVTQATLSRDVKELGLLKVRGKEKRFKYAYTPEPQVAISQIDIFKNCIVSINLSLNLIVVKTTSGTANAVCIAVDNLNIPHVLGTIAGDDTFVVIVDGVETAEKVMRLFNKYKND